MWALSNRCLEIFVAFGGLVLVWRDGMIFPELLKLRLYRWTTFMSWGFAWCFAFTSFVDMYFWILYYIYTWYGKCLMVSLHIQTIADFFGARKFSNLVNNLFVFLLGKLIVICLIYLKLIASHLNMVGLDPPTISVNSELQSLGQGSTVADKCPNSCYGVDILMMMLHVSVDVFLFHFVSFVFFSSYSCYFVYPRSREILTMCVPNKIFRFPGGSVSLRIVPTGIPIFEDHDQLQLSASFLGRLGRLFQGEVPFKGFWTKLKGLPWEEVGRKVISKNRNIKKTRFYHVWPSLLRREAWFR